MLNPKENKFAMSSLEGKIFNIHDDMTYFSMKDTGTIKDLTGSYTKEIEKKGKQRYGADIRAVHCFACNKPPKYDGEIKKDIACWERWVYIYFPNKFEKLLTFYDDNFTPENLSGFLNKVLDYVLDIGHDKKLVCNYSYTDVRNTWAKCADPVYRFINENMIKSETSTMYYNKDLFLGLIKAWAKDQGEGEDEEIPNTITMLSQNIDICGIDKNTRVTEEKSGMEQHVYGLPYIWKNDSKFKDFIPRVIPVRKQVKF
jgi:putative DNA primase/helicase